MRAIQVGIRWGISLYLLVKCWQGKIWAIALLLTFTFLAFEIIALDLKRITKKGNQ